MKKVRILIALLLVLSFAVSMVPAYAIGPARSEDADRSVHSGITLDENSDGGYAGDYVVIYNPSTDYQDARSTGTMTGRIETGISSNTARSAVQDPNLPYIIDVDDQMAQLVDPSDFDKLPTSTAETKAEKQLYNVGDLKNFTIYGAYSPTGSENVEFKCLYVGEHCYIWTPSLDNGITYPLDKLNEDFAGIAAAEFDSKYDLMQSSFGEHLNFGTGDNRLHMLYYNINEGWEPGRGYMAGFFYAADLVENGMPILNIDTYPGVYYPNYYGEGKPWIRTDSTYNTMVHEYQHLINFSNNYRYGGMHSWLNESFSAAAEEICYPGSSVVARIQSWENYSYSANNDWLSPPAEFEYQPSFNLHNGYSLYDWSNDLSDVLALYGQVSMFSQYLYTHYGNPIYRSITENYTGDCAAAVTAATGKDCSELVKEFRISVTANAAMDQYDGKYSFKTQEGYDPSKYHNVENPWSLLGPVVFTGDSCSIKGGGSITVKPVGGVYVPPADADPGLVYIGIKLAPRPQYTVNISVCGVTESSETIYDNESITLPAEVSATVEGWSFVGWAERDVADTTETPDFFAPGASYTVTADATLYALFARTEGENTRYRTDPVPTHTPVLVPAAPPTCTEDGNIAYYQCSECSKYFSDESCESEIAIETTSVPATGHTPGEPVEENRVASTCTVPGGYDTVTYCTVCNAELSREHTELPTVDHTPGEPAQENEVTPTCTEPGGFDTVVRCTVCGTILSTEHTEIPATGHTPGDPVKADEVAPTCTEAGGYDMVTCCTVCGVELSREHTEIPPSGHDWNEPAYVWADDYSSVTATRVCKNDETHVETETVRPTAEVTKEATVDEEGEIVYTATFANEAFETQTLTVATPKLEPPTPENPFEDVEEGKYYYDAVLWAVNHEPQITKGTDDTHFAPNNDCTRGQVVTFLWRAQGCPEPNSVILSEAKNLQGDSSAQAPQNDTPQNDMRGANPFSDVSETAFYYKAVLWAVENNITKGIDDTHFGPGNSCTRGQVVTFLWRTAGEPAATVAEEPIVPGEDETPIVPRDPDEPECPFEDVNSEAYYYKAMLWAVANGITKGTSDTTFAPGNTCTRGQVVTFLYRAFG